MSMITGNSPIVQILNASVFEDYFTITEEEMNDGFSNLRVIIEKGSTSFEYSKEQLDRIRHIVDITLKQFPALTWPVKRRVYEVAFCLSEQQCHENIKEFHCHIVHLWGQFREVQTAISRISIFLTPARLDHPLSAQQLDDSESLLAFSLKHPTSLSAEMRIELRRLTELIQLSPPVFHEEEEEEKKRYTRLQDLLKKASNVTGQVSTPSPQRKSEAVTWKVTEPEPDPLLLFGSHLSLKERIKQVFGKSKAPHGFEIISPDDSDPDCVAFMQSLEKAEAEAKSIQKAQKQKIAELCRDICQHYTLFLQQEASQQLYLKEFDRIFPLVAEELFFKPPSTVTPMQWEIVVQVFSQGVQILSEFNTQSTKYAEVSLENLHAPLILLMEHLFCRLYSEESATDALLSMFLANACKHFLDSLLNQDTIYFILGRLVGDDPWEQSDFGETPIPLSVFSSDDDVTEKLSALIEAIFAQLIVMGEPKGAANIGSKVLQPLVAIKKFDWAMQIQQKLHQIKSSPCTYTPLLVLHHLLLRKSDDKLQPAWSEWRKMDSQKKEEQQKQIQAKLHDRLYAKIYEHVATQSSFGAWILQHSSSIKTFSEKLMENLFQIMQKKISI